MDPAAADPVSLILVADPEKIADFLMWLNTTLVVRKLLEMLPDAATLHISATILRFLQERHANVLSVGESTKGLFGLTGGEQTCCLESVCLFVRPTC